MRKATLVLATSVAFLLFAVPNSYAGTKKKVQLPTAQSVANGSGVPVKSGSSLSIPGQLQQEYIPADNFSRSTPFKVLPTIDFSIPRTIEHSKGFLKNNAASIVVGGVIAGMIAGLDWVMGEGSEIQKVDNSPANYTPTGSDYYWTIISGYKFPSAFAACQHQANVFQASTWGSSITSVGLGTIRPGIDAQCVIEFTQGGGPDYIRPIAVLYGSSCPSGLSPSSNGTACVSSTPVPITEADFSRVDAYVTSQSAEWISSLLRESCSGSISPQRCYEDLKDNVSLSGPSTVNGPSTFTTTTGPNGTTTKEKKTTFQITYGSDYFIYAPTTTTTTVNPDGTSDVETEEETTEEEAQEEDIDTSIPDAYKPVLDKYESISTDVEDAQGPGPGINWGPWYTFGGSCTEIQAQLPIIGSWSTNYCPYIYDWVRPVLMFLFAVFTWHYCKEMFQEAIEKGRPI